MYIQWISIHFAGVCTYMCMYMFMYLYTYICITYA